VSLHRVAFGLVMVTAFSVGLGAVLIGIAIAVVLLGDRLDRLGGTRLGRLLPVLSAVVVTALGLGILARSVEALLAA
jgi:putative Mn2+ efflux pump MntP